ncbi:MAG: LapA family protein [Desulfobacterales bacterium]|nr:MAG: LapA family protein [Desulfobacterales bacterium]
MKKIKIGLWVILLLLVGLFFYQNKDFFMVKQSISYGLPFFKEHHAPDLPIAILFLFSFLIGLLGTYFFSLSDRFKAKKTIKNLNAAVTSHLEEISALRKEVETLRGGSTTTHADAKETAAGST